MLKFLGHADALRMLIEVEGKELVMACAHAASENGHAEAPGVLIEAGEQGAGDADDQRRHVVCLGGFCKRAS